MPVPVQIYDCVTILSCQHISRYIL